MRASMVPRPLPEVSGVCAFPKLAAGNVAIRSFVVVALCVGHSVALDIVSTMRAVSTRRGHAAVQAERVDPQGLEVAHTPMSSSERPQAHQEPLPWRGAGQAWAAPAVGTHAG